MAVTLSTQISELAKQLGVDIKAILSSIGNLSELSTAQKASLVLALNELKAGLTQIEGKLGAQIDDLQTVTTKTWSSTKINDTINKAVSDLVGGAPDTLDTLKELADALNTNKDAITALQSIAQGHVKFDAVQSLSDTQKKQARDNIGASSKAEIDAVDGKIGVLTNLSTTEKKSVVGAINELKLSTDEAKRSASAAETSATSAKQGVDTLKTQVGDTSTDFVAVYTSARNGS